MPLYKYYKPLNSKIKGKHCKDIHAMQKSCPAQPIEAAWLLSTRTPREPSNCSLCIIRPVVRSRQGRVLLKCKTSTCATEAVSYGIAIERSKSRASERTSESTSTIAASVSSILWLRIDVIQVWKKLSCICMLTIYSFAARVSQQMPLIWLPEPWTLSTPWRPGCRQIGYDWTLIKPSSSGWAPATSLEDVTCRPPALFRSVSDNLVTIYCFSNRNWKRISFSSSERFCGSISNEGPYKFSILLLLLLLSSVSTCCLYSHSSSSSRSGRSPRLPSRDILSRPHLSQENVAKWRRSPEHPSILPHH